MTLAKRQAYFCGFASRSVLSFQKNYRVHCPGITRGLPITVRSTPDFENGTEWNGTEYDYMTVRNCSCTTNFVVEKASTRTARDTAHFHARD